MQKIIYICIQTNVQGRSVGGSLAVGHIPHLKILRILHRNNFELRKEEKNVFTARRQATRLI